MAWPTDPIDLEVGLFINGAWVDAVATGDGVRLSDAVTLNHGRSDWAAQVDPGRASFTLDNRDGRWSPDYGAGAYAGNYRRNIPCRVGIGRGEVHLAPTAVSADVASTPDIAGTGGGAPTAPTHIDVTESAETAYTTSHDVDMPATVAAGNRLVCAVTFGHQNYTAPTELATWTLAAAENLYTPWNGWAIYISPVLDTTAAAALAGATVTFTTTNAVRSSAQVIRVGGSRAGGEGIAWDIAYDLTSTSSASPNPPSLTTSWGADEHRWYAFAFYGSAGETVSAYPTSFTSVADGNVASLVQIGSAHHTTSLATLDPAVFTLTGAENWQGVTLVFRAIEDASSDGVLDVSGDIDLRVELEPAEDPNRLAADGTGERIRLAHKTSGANGFEWELYTANDGALVSNFSWWDSSGVAHNVTTEATGTDLPLDFLHEHRALRVDLDVDNGASGHDLTWYTSTVIDGTWTQLGSTVTTAGTTSIGTNDAPLRIGGNPGDANHAPFPGKIFAFDLRNEIDTVIANPRFNAQAVGATSFADAAGRTWTIGTGGRITNMLWRFHGELASLPVRWEVQGVDVTAPVEATGLFRRLRQGKRRLDSAIRRAIVSSATDVIQYWPCEEEGPNVSAFGAAIGTASFILEDPTHVPAPNAASNNVFLASAPLPTLGDSHMYCNVDSYTASGEWQLRWLQHIPDTFTAGAALTYLSIGTTDIDWFVQFRDDAGGQLRIVASRGLTNVYTGTWTSFNATGRGFRMTLSVQQNGSSVNLLLTGQEQDQPIAGGFDITSAVAGSAGRVTFIDINPQFNVGDWAFGHFTLQGTETPSTELATELNAYDGEKAGDRIVRLLEEEGIAHRIEGNPSDTEQMGPQRAGTLMDLLDECAATDLGILHESRESVAVGYRTRTSMTNQPIIIDLDYSAGEVAAPPQLDRDDSDFANDVQVKNKSGSTARAVLDDGSALSVSEPPVGAGRYDDTFDVNGQDTRLKDLAETRLALSTVDEPRVSKLTLALHTPELVGDVALTSAILDSSLGDRIRVANNLTVALGTADIDQIIQGTREQIGNYTHTIDALTTPYSPWATGGGVVDPPEAHSVSFRRQDTLATSGAPAHVLDALGYTGTYPIVRADLDDILDDWVASTGGATRNVTSAATWTTAMGNALPGDLVRVTTGFDPGGAITARGDLYGLSGSNLTASPDGGEAGLPIIVTCADGVFVDDNDTSSNVGVLDLTNCRHVWAVGFNVRDGQFGIRTLNWGGTAGFPAYIAYCTVDNIGDAGITLQGWFQLITTSGGTPPAGSGNEWGYSEFAVVEENTIDGVGLRTGVAPGEGIYLGRGSAPGWVSYAADVWVRGNRATDWTSDALDVKPGCRRIYITDNEFYIGHASSGAPMSILYVSADLDTRDGTAFDIDPEVWVEGNRVYDNNITNTEGTSTNIMGYIGLSGIRIANNVMWAKPETGTHPMWRARNELGANDTEALAEFRNDPTWVINNTFWGDDSFENAGYGSPFVGAFPGTITFDLRNNIVDQASPATGEVDAAAADFIATVPAIGAAGDAEWLTYGNGSAFDLALTSALIGAGASITDIDFYIAEDISQRTINRTTPNPGAFQPHPAN